MPHNNEKELLEVDDTQGLDTVANPIPLFSEDLIDNLDRDFPSINPTPQDSLAKIMYAAGARMIVDTLLERKRGTNLAKLKGDITINV